MSRTDRPDADAGDGGVRIHGALDRTEFVLYVGEDGVLDFVERRLLQLLKASRSTKRKSQLEGLLSSYRNRAVAVAFQRGEPMYVRVTRESNGEVLPSELND